MAKKKDNPTQKIWEAQSEGKTVAEAVFEETTGQYVILNKITGNECRTTSPMTLRNMWSITLSSIERITGKKPEERK